MQNKEQNIPLPVRNIEHSGRQLFSLVNKIPPEAAKAVSELFIVIAQELKDQHQIYLRQKAINDSVKKNRFNLHQLPIKIQNQLNSGMSFQEAVDHLKSTTGTPQATIYHYWLQHIKNLEKEAFIVRDQEIWKLYKSGKKDQQIADRVDLSTRQVRRIIREYKKRGADQHPF